MPDFLSLATAGVIGSAGTWLLFEAFVSWFKAGTRVASDQAAD